MFNNFTTYLIKTLAIIFLFFFLNSCDKSSIKRVDYFLCTAEKYDTAFLYYNNISFRGVDLIDSTTSKSGKYSLKLDSNNRYAYTTDIYLDNKFMYKLSFWNKGRNSDVYAVVQTDSNFYMNSSSIVEEDENGWCKKSLIFSIPQNQKDNKVTLYVWNSGNQTTYVDDFSLTKSDILDTQNDTILWLYLDEDAYNKILDKRTEALRTHLLITSSDSWVKGMAFWGVNDYKIKLRLKGDWPDHLGGIKWSFRIKIKNNTSFKGLRVFSVQNPNTRFFIYQWLLYTVFRSEDLLAPRYGFVYGQLNEDFIGLYAYVEHFTKQLVESLKRREGPIIKFSESSFWDYILAHLREEKWIVYPFYESSKIVPFSENKIVKNTTLYDNFKIAQNLLYQYKWGIGNISDLFDVDKAAKYIALTNVMKGYHNFRWHNQRFYYNPIISKLEFIAYDNYVGPGIFVLPKKAIYGDFEPDRTGEDLEFLVYYYAFKDPEFVSLYIKYLDEYSRKGYWDSVFNAYDEQIYNYQNKIIKEYPNSYFDKTIIYKSISNIRAELPEYVEKVNNGFHNNIILPNKKQDDYENFEYPAFLKNYINVYTEKTIDNKSTIKVANYYLTELEIIGYGTSDDDFTYEKIKLPPYSTDNYKVEFEADANIEYILVSNGTDEIKIDVLRWPEPKAWSPRQELENNNKFPNQDYYTVIDDTVIFEGKQVINEIILIPENYTVIFKEGTEIDFIEKGGFISYSSVFMNGTKSNPINILSSDNTANGFTILQADKTEMNYVFFDGLDNFSYKGWMQTGAVVIYETETYIDNCTFKNNHCEDDLNIVRSNFEVRNSLLYNTFSDAFDSDFCTGIVDNCKFEKLGNDAIDFSTSEISITNCTIKNAEDKGISGGEASKLKVENCTIDGANIAIASKDKSVLELENIDVKNVIYVITVFKKKPEYGHAKIIAKNLTYDNYMHKFLVEKKSTLIIDDNQIDGAHKDVAKKFY